MSRSATGDLIKGGYPEVVLGSGDGIGSLNLYEWNGENWAKTTLIDTTILGHTLNVGDMNGDGKGNFTIEIISIGIGTWR